MYEECPMETCALNLKSVALTVLELLAFSAPTVRLTGSLCTQTHRQTENNIFINSLHSLGGDKNISKFYISLYQLFACCVLYKNIARLLSSITTFLFANECGVLAVNLNIQACVGYFLLYVLYMSSAVSKQQFLKHNFIKVFIEHYEQILWHNKHDMTDLSGFITKL